MKSFKQLKNTKGITLIALVVTIVVLLILAAISISMLTGDNGIINQARNSKDKTEQAKCEELVTVAINALIAKNSEDRSKITPDDIAKEVNNMENRTDVLAQDSIFPTNILFPKEDREVGVNIELGVVDTIKNTVYNEEGLEEEAEKNVNLFLYEEIEETGEIGATEIENLPVKEVRITGMNPKYCNNKDYISETGKIYENTNYEIILEDGTKISDTLVIPYQVSGKYISGADENEMYKITEVSLRVMNADKLPIIKTIIYPNTIESMGEVGTTVQKVVLSKNLKEIESGTFAGCNLTSITIPSSVTSIGDYAFSECSSLTSIQIPSSVTNIGSSTFSRCSSLTSIEIPSSVTSIEWGAFSGCSSLTNIEISNSTTSIGDYAFSECISLTSITIPSSVTSIGRNAFEECSNLTSIEIPNSITSISMFTFSGCSSLTSIEIPNSVTSIGWCAFEECSSLASIEIPNSVTSIEDKAFEYCSSLTSIEIPSSVTNIGGTAFEGTPWLDSKNEGEIYINNVFFKYKGTMPNNTNINIKENTVSISSYAFEDCAGLTSIEIPNSVRSIGDRAFSGCNRLKSIEIPNGVTSIGTGAFSRTGLTNIEIPSSVSVIEDRLFELCYSLTNVTIPKSITSIGMFAFATSGIKKVNYSGTITEWKSIPKGQSDELDEAKIICTDGEIN